MGKICLLCPVLIGLSVSVPAIAAEKVELSMDAKVEANALNRDW